VAANDAETFFQRTRHARKVMVLDLGFLGDTVHLLPALWMLRQAYPKAELHVAVASHIASFMDCVPWVNRVWGYTRFPKHASLKENLDFITGMRGEKFDAVINLNGSDRSSWLTFLSGARERLGRLPEDGGPLLWRQMFTAYISHPFDTEPVYWQRCHCLERAGFPFAKPEFHVEIAPENLRAAEIADGDRETYFHLSPFTTANYKELPPEQLVELIGALQRHFPTKKLAVSCAPTPRELAKMERLLTSLPQRPWRVFAGSLNLIQLAAVIRHCALHFCGDTGTLHLAVMTQTPVVAWFWPNPGIRVWSPEGNGHRTMVGHNEPGKSYLCGIHTEELVRAADATLAAAAAAKPIGKEP
jgi:ADP-heptose:LPS heptosyltransferase